MAKSVLKHKGYLGSVEVSLEDCCLHGKLLHVRDVISYEGATVAELECSFREAVDDYLETCVELNRNPQKPFGGTFNVRVGPELHREAVTRAEIKGVSLNDYIRAALEGYIHHEKARYIGSGANVVAGVSVTNVCSSRHRYEWLIPAQAAVEFTMVAVERSSRPQEEDDPLWITQPILPSPQH